MKKHSIFVTFEGGEGSGKSTVSKLVAERLEKNSIKTSITREPGGKDLKFSEDIRKIIMNNNDLDLITELLLFQASRREHITKVIKPALANGDLVISDRFTDSSIVYQGAVKGLPIELVKMVNDITVQDFYPHLTIIFDLDAKIGIERINKVSRITNRFDQETIEFQKKVRSEFLKLSITNSQRYRIIDASKPLDEVVDEVFSLIISAKQEVELREYQLKRRWKIELEVKSQKCKKIDFKI